MNQILEKRKGITLIALVITIIVLIILAGIAVSMLIGDNGILSKAEIAKNSTEMANQAETEKLSKYNNTIDSYLTTSRSGMDESSVQALINQSLTWKYLGTTTGTTAITLPTDYNELIIKANVTNGVNYSIHLSREELNTSYETYYMGFSNGSANTCRIQASKTSAALLQVEMNGASVTSSSVLYYYYR